MTLQFEFIDVEQIDLKLQDEIEMIDRLAYIDPKPEVAHWPGKWANPSWMILGRLDGVLVSQLCMLKREIMVGEQYLGVAGVGGVATHPDWQRKGFAKQLMTYAEGVIRNELKCSFALLLCNGMPCSIYRKAGWKDVAKHIKYQENENKVQLETNVMVFEISDRSFPEGEIDICGLPW
jgi:GNAT superfamily N-acetyltransferase